MKTCLVCGLLFVGVALTACGSSHEDAGQLPRFTPRTPDAVSRHFEDVTGLPLVTTGASESLGFVHLGAHTFSTTPEGDLTSTRDERLFARFGEFAVFVFADPDEARALSWGTPDLQDPGVLWRESPPEFPGDHRTWSARKLYENVQLAVFDLRTRTLDQRRWKELEAIFDSMPATGPGS